MSSTDKTWWQRPQRIIQPNLQVMDTARIDPEALAAEMKDMGATAIVFNTGGIYAWYPTKVPYHTVNPYLPTAQDRDRDLLREVIEACHRQGIRFIARYDFSKADDKVYLNRPEWFVRKAGNEPEVVGELRAGPWPLLMNTCINGDYRNGAVAEAVLRESLTRYDIDGVFFNAPGYFYCQCARCRQIYREKYGKELPDTPGGLEPGFPSACMRDNMERMYRLIHAVRPEVPMILYYNLYKDNLFERVETADLLCTEPQDILSLGHKSIPEFWKPALSIKLGRSLPDRPSPFGIVHSCPGMDWRHTGLPVAEYRFWLAQIPAHGGQIWHSLTGVPDTITDKRILDVVKELNLQAAKVDGYMEDAAPVSQVALLWNAASSAEGWADALINKQLPFDVLLPEQALPERLRQYKALVIPEGFTYDGEFTGRLAAYIQGGGYVLAEGPLPLAVPGLAELAGVKPEAFASEELAASYLRFEGADNPLQRGLEATELIAHRGRVAYCQPAEGADTRVLATLVPPFSPLVSVGAPPERASLPVSRTDLPLAIHSRPARDPAAGGMLYFPFSLSRLINEYKLEEHYKLVENGIGLALRDQPFIRVTPYPGLQLTVFRKGQSLLIHFVNGAGRRPLAATLPLHHIQVELRTAQAATQLLAVRPLLTGQVIGFTADDNILRFTLPRLEVWECVLVEGVCLEGV